MNILVDVFFGQIEEELPFEYSGIVDDNSWIADLK